MVVLVKWDLTTAFPSTESVAIDGPPCAPSYRKLLGSVWFESLRFRRTRVLSVREALPAKIPVGIGCGERCASYVFGDLEPQLLEYLTLLVQRLHAQLLRGEGTNGIPGRRGAHHP